MKHQTFNTVCIVLLFFFYVILILVADYRLDKMNNRIPATYTIEFMQNDIRDLEYKLEPKIEIGEKFKIQIDGYYYLKDEYSIVLTEIKVLDIKGDKIYCKSPGNEILETFVVNADQIYCDLSFNTNPLYPTYKKMEARIDVE